MDATITIKINPRDAVPSSQAERIAWLEKFGPQRDILAVRVTASIISWSRAGATIRDDGSIVDLSDTGGAAAAAARALAHHVISHIRETGHAPASLDESIVERVAVPAAMASRSQLEQEEAAQIAQLRELGIESMLHRGDDGLWHDTWLSDATAKNRLCKSVLGDDCRARAQREAESRNAREAEARAPYLAAIHAHALTIDTLARAASEGYDVEKALLDHLSQQLAAAVDAVDYKVDCIAYSDPPDRPAPKASSFALLDRVTAAVAAANEALPTAIGRWVVSRIVRIDPCEHRGHEHPLTAVLATLRTPSLAHPVREISWSNENMECDHG